MRLKQNYSFFWTLLTILILFWSCSDMELKTQDKIVEQNLDLNSRASLSKLVLDSTKRAERLMEETVIANSNAVVEPLSGPPTTANYALQATVTAESTFPGYSVNKINDGNRTTTVGTSYSWANNHPAGGKLPESVFLKLIGSKLIDRIDIYTSTGYILKNYSVQYRPSNGAWINLFSIVGNTTVYRSHTFTAVTALEVRVICERGPDNQSVYGRLNEVEIYGRLPLLPSIGVENGMLSFSSMNSVTQTIAYLEFKYDEYDDAFLAAHPGLTDDQLAAVEESLGYNDEQPYLNFENQYGIASKRAQLTAAEDNWLATTSADYPNQNENPDYLFVEDDEVRTIVNVYGEMKIGTIYYHFNDDGSYYEVGAPFFNELVALRNLKANQPLPAHVTLINAPETTPLAPLPCAAGKRNRDYIKNGDWKFDYITGLWNFPWSHRIVAKTKSYKKVNGNWKKRRATIGAQVYGTVFDADCSQSQYLESSYVEKKKKKVKVKVFTGIKIKTIPGFGGVSSYHYSSKVGDISYSLTW